MRMNRLRGGTAIVTLITAMLVSGSVQAQSIGMVTDDTAQLVAVFDPVLPAVLTTIPIPNLENAGCCICPDETLGFVPNFQGEVYVIDLNTSPPSLAAGTNPIPISNDGESCGVTCDGRFLIVCDGSNADPVSVVDIAARAEIDTLMVGSDSNAVFVCDDGASILVTSFDDKTVRRLIIDSAGQLTDTGEVLNLDDEPNEVCAAPGTHSGVVVTRDPDAGPGGQAISFTIPGLTEVDTRDLSGSGFGIGCVICCDGTKLYTRRNDTFPDGFVDCWDYDWLTGAIGATPNFTIPVAWANTFFGTEHLAVNHDCTLLYVPETDEATPADSEVRIYDAETGAFLGFFSNPALVDPTGISFAPCCLPADCLVTDNNDGDVTAWNSEFMSPAGRITIPNAPVGLFDCCVTPDGTTGFVTNFQAEVWVIDMTTTPPQLATGTNPIPMTNQNGENCSITCDGAYLLVCNGGGLEPVSVIDIANRVEASFFPLQAGVGCREIECCDDGVSVLAVGSDDLLRRLEIDAAGNLTDTGESVSFGDDILNVCAASGSLTGVAVLQNIATVESFLIHGLTPVDSRPLSAGQGISCSICWDGSAVCVRRTNDVDCCYFDRYSGALGATPHLTIPGLETATPFFGVNQILLSRDCSKIYVTQHIPTSETSVFDAQTGALITSIIDPFNEIPLSVACPPCCEPCILYASDGSQGNASDLLILDPDTGDVIRNVGPIGFAVTGLAVDPFDGVLYGSTARASGTRALITIDRSTGAGTLVGNFNVGSQTMADIAFCPDGTLLGWVEPGDDDLAMINKATGQAQIIGDADVGTSRAGLAVDQAGSILFGGDTGFFEGLLQLDPYFGQVIGEVPYVPDLDLGVGMSFGPGNVLYAIERVNGTVRNLYTVNTTSGAITLIGPTVDFLDALAWDCPLPFPPVFKKVLVDGPDRNGDFQIDPIIERKSKTPSTWTFRIEFNQPTAPPAMVVDVIPPWLRLLDCTPDNPADLVTVTVGASNHDFHDVRPRIVTWFPTDNTGGLTCTVITRKHSSNRYEPHDCGGFFINEGAQAFETGGQPLLDEHGQPLVTRGICVGVVKDKNHDDFIDWTGQGDEDGDTLTDWFESCVLGTDPCDDDTDHDHVDDNVDADPLDKNVQ